VVALQEVTPDALTRLDAAGMGNAFPSSVRAPATGATGVALFSRRAVTEPVVVAGWPMGAVSARIERGAGIPGLTLFSVHVPAPWPWTDGGWRGQLAAMPNLFSVISGPLVVAGDFNATLDHAPFRSALEGAGLTDAARAAGAGWLPTFPADRPFPPVIAIDHVLVRDASAVLATTTTVTGTDHRALVATLTLPST
ncbi:MAG: endonuclease, partial [Frankiales bacterium]|nr:endonuclease [Frankiales bacterium]